MTAKARLISIILAVIFVSAALTGTGAYLIVNHFNNNTIIEASASTDYIIEDNLYNTDGTINSYAVRDFLDAIGYLDNPNDMGTYQANQILSRNNSEGYAGDKTILFKMGYYTNKDGTSDYTTEIVWQATYLWNGYLTIWMANSYTADYFNNGSTDASGWGNDTYYQSVGNYSRSLARDITNNIFSAFSIRFENFNDFVVSPNEANASWQATQANAYYNSTARWSVANGLLDNVNDGYGNPDDINDRNPYNWTWDSSVYHDKFWLPSHIEIFNTPEQIEARDDCGLWGITSANDRKDASNVAYDGSQIDTYSWLRSCYAGATVTSNALRINNEGNSGNALVNEVVCGIRPACHISLSALGEKGICTIFVQSNNNEFGTVAGGGDFNFKYVSKISIAAFPNEGYVFDYWQDSAGNKIYNNPFAFTATENETYTAFFKEIPITITSANNGVEIVSDNYIVDNISYRYNLTFTEGTYIYSININNGIEQRILSLNGTLIPDDSCTAINYNTNSSGSSLYLEIIGVTDNITINLTFSSLAQSFTPASGGANIDGVALQVSASDNSTNLAAVGEARITGYNQTDGLATIHVSAVASTGYRFVGWQVDGEILSGYTESADIPYNLVEGKILTVIFAPIDNSTQNSTTDNGYLNDFA